MKISEVREGELYQGKVNGRTVPVRVHKVERLKAWPQDTRMSIRITVENLLTKRVTTFRSAAKLSPMPETIQGGKYVRHIAPGVTEERPMRAHDSEGSDNEV